MQLFSSIMIGLIFGGAGVFTAFERSNELQRIEDSKVLLNQTMMNVVELLTNQTDLTDMEAIALTERLLDFGRIAADARENLALEENPIWDYSSGLFFCVTVLTTIGKYMHC